MIHTSHLVGESPISRREEQLRGRADSMTQRPTFAESLTATLLRQLDIPAKRQVVIGRYIADFIGTQQAFVLEIDGPIHVQQAAYDRTRDRFFTSLGWTVIRIPNEDVSLQRLRDAIAPVPRVAVRTITRRIANARQLEALRVKRTDETRHDRLYESAAHATGHGLRHASSTPVAIRISQDRGPASPGLVGQANKTAEEQDTIAVA